MNARVGPESDPAQPGSGRGTPASVSGATAHGYLLPIALCGLLLLVGAASVLWYLQRETRAMHLIDALEGSERFAQSVTQFRNF